MEAVVLAGGFGKRLREVVPNVPKPMAHVAGRPFLEILLRDLKRKGFERVVLSLGYKSEVIISHFGEQFAGLEIAYVVEDTPLDTGGAVRLAMSQCLEDHVFIFNGDTFPDLEVQVVENIWQECRASVIVARKVNDTARYGRLLVENGWLRGFREKGTSGPGLINAGCYVLGVHQLDAWSLNTPFSLETDHFASAGVTAPVCVFETNGSFIDIGVPDDYQRAQKMLAGL